MGGRLYPKGKWAVIKEEHTMRFQTYDECNAWIIGSGLKAPSLPTLEDGTHVLRCVIPFDRLRWFSRYIAKSCGSFDTCLLWPTLAFSDRGVWPSSENMHLYYRLRQSYGEQRLLSEAPGHLFLNYEFEDLATFVQLCLMFLWDTYLFTNLDYVSVLFSHDEFVEFRSTDEILLTAIHSELVGARIEILSN